VTAQDQAEATDRLRRALLAFQAAQNSLLGAHRRLKGLPQAEVEAFWRGPGRRLEAGMRATAAEAVAAFRRFSAALVHKSGPVASARSGPGVSGRFPPVWMTDALQGQ
jgi:hypothetical protein